MLAHYPFGPALTKIGPHAVQTLVQFMRAR